MKDGLGQQVKAYTETFHQWIRQRQQGPAAADDHRYRYPGHAAGDQSGHQSGAPERGGRDHALAASQSQTKILVIGIGIAVVFLGLVLS